MSEAAGVGPSGSDAESAGRWGNACIVAELFAVDPAGLGGVALRSGASHLRQSWLDILRALLPPGSPLRRMPAGIEDDRLLGGIDLAATLRSGRPVVQSGLLAETDGGVVVVSMAERLSPGVAARLAQVLDRGEVAIEREGIARVLPARIGIVALDEGEGPDETLAEPVSERLAFLVELDTIRVPEAVPEFFDPGAIRAARLALEAVEPASEEIVRSLVSTAAALGIVSVTAPLLALRAARAAAALDGRREIRAADAVLAAALVLAPRAQIAPETLDEVAEAPDEAAEDAAPDPPSDSNSAPPPGRDPLPETAQQDQPAETPEPPPVPGGLEAVMLAAAQAALPPGLLSALRAGATRQAPAGRRQGKGAVEASRLRGRPAGVRVGGLGTGGRLALIDTLRAAAPWQKLRRRDAGIALAHVAVRPEDFRVKKFVRRRETAIVFCVDASGSAAFHRLAETKGAVELLLGEAYVERTHVALIVFRGAGAEVLVPPTRSLSRARALLATLPGGGGTPLAAGIDAARLAAQAERARGRQPLIVVLTDGRANIARGGKPSRPLAAAEALEAARGLGAERLAAVVVDTAPRPGAVAAELAAAMGARYVALPYVEARAVRDVVRAATPAAQPRAR